MQDYNFFEREIDLNYQDISTLDSKLMYETKFIQSGHRPKVIDIADCTIEYCMSSINLQPLWMLQSLEGIGRKYFKIIWGTLTLPQMISRNMLGICLIQHLVDTDFLHDANTISKMHQADRIITRGTWQYRKNELLERKEELIAAGLKEYARL
jgi:hypothetical protein